MRIERCERCGSCGMSEYVESQDGYSVGIERASLDFICG
jgi:hypothetical protein